MATAAFVCSPVALFGHPVATCTDKYVYDGILSFKNRRTGQCNPRENRLAEKLGVSIRTVQRAIANLRQIGAVVSRRTLTGNWYELPTPDQWMVGVQPPKMAGGQPPKMAGGNRQKWRVPTIKEPDVLEPESAPLSPTANPAPPTEAAAAAPPCRVHDNATPPAPPVADVVADAVTVRAAAVAQALLPVHPEPGLPRKAAPVIERILRSAANVEETAERMATSHAGWLEYWRTLPAGRFIPQLWRWFRDGDWENPPAVRKPVVRESWAEQRKREYREEEESTYRMYAENEMWDALRECGGDELVEVWRAKVESAA